MDQNFLFIIFYKKSNFRLLPENNHYKLMNKQKKKKKTSLEPLHTPLTKVIK